MFSSLLSRVAWNPYYASTPRRHSSTRLKLPAIIPSLDSKFELEVNEWCSRVTNDTKEWTDSQINFTRLRRKGTTNGEGGTEETEDNQRVIDSTMIPDIQSALLAAMGFPFADYTQLRICADCLQWMFLLQWWAFEGSILFKYGNEGHNADISLSSHQPSPTVEEGLSSLLDSVLNRIPKKDLSPVSSSLITYCEQLALQSTNDSEDECVDSRIIVLARQQIKIFVANIQKPSPSPSPLSPFPWSAPFLTLLDLAYDFSSSEDDKSITDAKRAATEILQWTHDMLSFTSALCSSSDPARRLERYPAWFVSSTLLDICKTQQGTPLLARIGLLSPPRGPLFIKDLQLAVDTLGVRIVQRMDDLLALRPDQEGASEKNRYWRAVTGLVAGVLHWSFQSEFYFRPSSIGTHVAMHCLLDVDNFHVLSGLQH